MFLLSLILILLAAGGLWFLAALIGMGISIIVFLIRVLDVIICIAIIVWLVKKLLH